MSLVSKKQIFDFFIPFFSHLLLTHNALNLTYLSVQISCFDIPFTYGQKVLKIYKKLKPSFFLMLSRIKKVDIKKNTGSDLFFQIYIFLFLKQIRPSVKIKIMCRKVCLRCKGTTLLGIVNKPLKTKSLLTSPSNVLPYYLK